MVSGSRDLAVLLIAVSGVLMVGPVGLFFPTGFSWRAGWTVWYYLAVFYFLLAFYAIGKQKPRINIYNATLLELRPILAEIALELDEEARWAGDALALPKLEMLLYLESQKTTANVSLISCHFCADQSQWRRLQNALTGKLRTYVPAKTRYFGVTLFLIGLITFIFLHGMIWYNSADFLRAIPELLRI